MLADWASRWLVSGEGVVCLREMKVRRLSARVAVLPSGRVLVVTGSYFSLRGDESAFLGLLLPSVYSARVAAAVHGRRWSRRGLVGRLTALRVLRPSGT